jgi:predicted Zn-dependent protease
MTQAGYDPREMLGVMEILKNASKSRGGQPEFLMTPPLPDTRLKEIESRLKEMFPSGIPTQLTKGRSLG